MDQIIINFLSKLELGELQAFSNMAIIPLFNSVNHTPQYLSLGEAMGKGFPVRSSPEGNPCHDEWKSHWARHPLPSVCL